MKKIIFAVVAFFLALNADAQVIGKISLEPNQRLFGYYLSDELAIQGSGLPEWGECNNSKAAIEFTTDMLRPYVGGKIVAVRFGISQSLEKSRVFIAPSEALEEEKEDFVSKDVPAPVVGWNLITLEKPYTIDAGQAIIVGYDYQQKTDKGAGGIYKSTCYPLSIVRAGINTMANLLYTNKNGTMGWYEQSKGKGANLSIQVIIEGDFKDYCAMPYDFGTAATELGKETSAKVLVMNNGASAIESLSYVATVDGKSAAEKEIKLDTPIAVGASSNITVVLPGISEYARKKATVEITKVNGNKNLAPTTVASGYVGVAKDFFPRNVVLEEFTTERCGNCPRVAEYLHEALENLDLTKVFPVCHHSAYGTDWLTKDCDTEIVNLMFNSTGGFAPAMMFNRDESLVPEEESSKKGNVMIPGSAEIIKAFVNNALTKVANSQLEMEVVPSTDESKATVIIKGKCNDAFDIDNSLLTLYLTEDDIQAKSQAQGGNDFRHMHVIRYYNSVWGDKVVWNDNATFTATYNIDIDQEWNKDKMNVVAFLNKHDASDYTNSKIDNSIGMAYSKGADGIDGITSEGVATGAVCYSIDGSKLSEPAKGINIIKLSDGRAVKIVVK